MDASGPGRGERLAERNRIRPRARRDRDRRRLSVHVRTDGRLRSQGHARVLVEPRPEVGLKMHHEGGRTMSNLEVIARLTIRPGQLEGFKAQAAEMMRLTRELDTKIVRYDWHIDEVAML